MTGDEAGAWTVMSSDWLVSHRTKLTDSVASGLSRCVTLDGYARERTLSGPRSAVPGRPGGGGGDRGGRGVTGGGRGDR